MKRNALTLMLIASLLISLTPVVYVSSSSTSTPTVPPAMEWDAVYGPVRGLRMSQIIQTSDGGYAMAGERVVHSYIIPPAEVWFVKADATGKMEWNQTYDHLYDAAGVVQTPDGGYVMAGNCYTIDPELLVHPEGIRLFKTDANGKVQWNQTYKDPNVWYWNGASSIVQTNDGGYAIAGKSGNSGFLIKTDSYGQFQFKRTYGEPDKGNSFSSVIQTSDGGYAAAGTTDFNGSKSFWLVKIDGIGDVLWSQTCGSGDNQGNSVVQTADGGYVIAGNTLTYGAAGASDAWLVKTDSHGNMVWNQTYGGTDNDFAYSLIQTSDGGLAFAGETAMGNSLAWLVKTDSSGNVEWNQTYPKPNEPNGFGIPARTPCLVETSDGGFALGGTWLYPDAVFSDYYFLVKTEPVLPPPTPTPTPSSPPSTGFLSGENLVLFASLAVAAVLIALVAVVVFRRRKRQISPTSFT